MEDGVRAGAARGVPQRINAGASKAPVKKMTISLKKGTASPALPSRTPPDHFRTCPYEILGDAAAFEPHALSAAVITQHEHARKPPDTCAPSCEQRFLATPSRSFPGGPVLQC